MFLFCFWLHLKNNNKNNTHTKPPIKHLKCHPALGFNVLSHFSSEVIEIQRSNLPDIAHKGAREVGRKQNQNSWILIKTGKNGAFQGFGRAQGPVWCFWELAVRCLCLPEMFWPVSHEMMLSGQVWMGWCSAVPGCAELLKAEKWDLAPLFRKGNGPFRHINMYLSPSVG